MTLTRFGIQIGLLTFSYYGLLIVFANLLALWLTAKRAKKYQQPVTFLWDLALLMLTFAILGARLWYAAFPPPSAQSIGIDAVFYRSSPLDFLAFWQGGFAMPGAFLGGALGFFLVLLRKKADLNTWLRIIAPVIPMLVGIIVWGNFINQQNYGLPSNLPWAIAIDPAFRLPGFGQVERYHPLFLYQSLWALLVLLLFLLLEKIRKNNVVNHASFWLMVSSLSLGLYALEFLRLDAGSASFANRIFWLILAILSAAMVALRSDRNKHTDR
jgi:phosphatidylglycerol---prolipoprotein diacylglyceryl transferase